jgi:hypothetical protein
MIDWLDVHEFIQKLRQCHDYRGDIDYDRLRAVTRSHFTPKGKLLFDQICECMDSSDYGLYEVDFDKLRKLCGVES